MAAILEPAVQVGAAVERGVDLLGDEEVGPHVVEFGDQRIARSAGVQRRVGLGAVVSVEHDRTSGAPPPVNEGNAIGKTAGVRRRPPGGFVETSLQVDHEQDGVGFDDGQGCHGSQSSSGPDPAPVTEWSWITKIRP